MVGRNSNILGEGFVGSFRDSHYEECDREGTSDE